MTLPTGPTGGVSAAPAAAEAPGMTGATTLTAGSKGGVGTAAASAGFGGGTGAASGGFRGGVGVAVGIGGFGGGTGARTTGSARSTLAAAGLARGPSLLRGAVGGTGFPVRQDCRYCLNVSRDTQACLPTTRICPRAHCCAAASSPQKEKHKPAGRSTLRTPAKIASPPRNDLDISSRPYTNVVAGGAGRAGAAFATNAS